MIFARFGQGSGVLGPSGAERFFLDDIPPYTALIPYPFRSMFTKPSTKPPPILVFTYNDPKSPYMVYPPISRILLHEDEVLLIMIEEFKKI